MRGRDLRFFLFGAVCLAFLIALSVVIAAISGIYNVAADVPRGTVVGHFIAFVRERSIDVRQDGIVVPPLDRPEMIADGASDYDEMCTGCHLAPGMAENEIRQGLDPRPPLLAKGLPGEPKEQFWIVKHGIEMTAMPAWGRTHSDVEIWNIVAFLQQLPALTPQNYHALVAKGGSHHHHEMGEAGRMKM